MKETLKTKAYNAILEKIMSGVYTPQSKISEEMLVQELGVSRTPIREALSRLESENYITVIPKRGIMVNSISPEEIEAIYDARIFLEPNLILQYGYKIDRELLVQLSGRLLGSSGPTDTVEFEVDNALHKAFYDASGIKYLADVYNRLNSYNFRSIFWQKDDEKILLDNSHREIINLLLLYDYFGAAEAVRTHLTLSKENAIKKYSAISEEV